MNSERILSCRSLIKEDVNFWKEDLAKTNKINFEAMNECLERRRNEILEAELTDKSSEVATTIAGYVARKLLKPKRCKCSECKIVLSTHDADVENDSYLSLLSRGKLFVPSKALSEFVCHCFAIIDLLEAEILSMSGKEKYVRDTAFYILKNFGPKSDFTCSLQHFATKIIINIYFNNKRKLAKDSVRQDDVVAFKSTKRQKVAVGDL